MPRFLLRLRDRFLRFGGAHPLLVSVLVSAIVTSTLALVVLAPLLAPSGSEPPGSVAGAAANASRLEPEPEEPTATARPSPTPTAWLRRLRGSSPTPEPEPSQPPTSTPRAKPTATPAPSPTPVLTEPTATSEPVAAKALYQADGDGGLDAWSGGQNWLLDDGVLVNDGRAVQTQPWITVPEPAVVDGGYAVEIEVRVIGVASGYCEQNFGVVAVAPDGRSYLGGGVLYTCDGGGPLVRITDVTDWTNGYNRDRALASARFDPENDWHALRLEVDAGEVRLLIDGEVVATAPSAEPATGTREVEIGLWSQGVQLAIRQIAVEPLPQAA